MYTELLLFCTFLLTAFSVIGNDVIQTLGTYISSNKGTHWSLQFLFIGLILLGTVLASWYLNNGDVTYGRSSELEIHSSQLGWWILLPPVALLVLTRFGIPISTTFLILSTFSPQLLISKMVVKSILGYLIAFGFSVIFYYLFSQVLKKTIRSKNSRLWMVLQWFTTGILWTTWLMQDLVNMFIYYPNPIDIERLILLCLVLLIIVAFILRARGGKIQEVVDQKSATHSLASATIIDLVYALILVLFTYVNNVPMSTTWVFIGLLGGRELGMHLSLKSGKLKHARKLITRDLIKVSIGMSASLLLTMLMYYFFVAE